MNKEGEKEQAEFLNSENRRIIIILAKEWRNTERNSQWKQTAARKSCDKVLCAQLLKTLVTRSHIIFEHSKTCTRRQLADYKQGSTGMTVQLSQVQLLKPDLASMKSVEVGTRRDKHYQDVNQWDALSRAGALRKIQEMVHWPCKEK